jgi:hypothetical protein
VEFTVSPIILKAADIDIILGMDLLTEREAITQCKDKIVVLTISASNPLVGFG